MSETRRAPRRLTVQDYLICYTLYAVLIALGFVVAFVIWPPAIVAATIAVTNSMWVHRGVYPWSMILLGMGWLVLVMTAGSYLTNGMARHRLWPRFARLAISLVLLAALGLLLTWLSTPSI